jgi:uncharacterized protein DUF4145
VTKTVTPSLGLNAFTCPRCDAYAEQVKVSLKTPQGGDSQVSRVRCLVCGGFTLWLETQMIDPRGKYGPPAHASTPDNVLELYEEARDVGGASRRAAAALLRLALQTLLTDLEPGHANLNATIGALVDRNLDPQVQQAMDVLRVIGNNAVHPGEVQLDEDPELVPALFELINLVVEQLIARPERVSALFDALPAGAREAVERRDGREARH